MKLRIAGFFLLLGIILISTSFLVVKKESTPALLSPLPANLFPIHFPSSSQGSKKEIFGFLPFWNLKYEPSIRYQQLSTIAFFGLDVTATGTIKTRTADGYEEPGWTAYQSGTFGAIVRKAHDNEASVVLVLRAFDNNTIESILLHKERQQKIIEETMKIVKLKNLDGVNLDFEYTGSPLPQVKKQFVEFVKNFHAQCSSPSIHCTISVDTYADAATTERLWNITALGKEADFIVVMAYDFTRPSSDYSGPVAPLQQIKEALLAFLQTVSPDKLLLGVPYYGYEWPTYSKEPISKTRSPGYIATYKRIRELVLSASSKLGWDNDSFTPYLISTESGRTTQIFYDDTLSLGLKYDFVNEAKLKGVAIWALGYDTPHTELWNLLQEKFGKK